MKVGFGFDVHQFEDGRPLILGGVTLAHDRGLVGHSDGDVLSHAITDAVLGAAVLGDLGHHFPSDDATWKDAPSLDFVRKAVQMLSTVWLRVEHVDATVVCERPAIAPHRDAMRQALSEALALKAEDLSIKATTSDGLGFTGRGEGIAAYAVVVLASTV